MENKILQIVSFVVIINILSYANLYPQITIGNGHMWAIGDHGVAHMVGDTTGVNPGNSGANQTWNFSNINIGSDSIVANVVNPNTTPYFSYFPTSNIAMITGGYNYYTISDGDMNMIGSVDGTLPDQKITIFSDPELYLRIPFTYNSTFTDNYFATFAFSFGDTGIKRGIVTKTADSWGTIILPGGTFNNVLRIHTISDETDSVIAPYPHVERRIGHEYSWYSSQYKNPLFWITIVTDTSSQIIEKFGMVMTTNQPIGVTPISNQIVSEYKLHQNYPNPFNPSTSITFDIVKTSDIKLIVNDALGRNVVELVNERLSNGSYKVDFNAANLTSGVYYYKLIAGDFSETKIMMLVK